MSSVLDQKALCDDYELSSNDNKIRFREEDNNDQEEDKFNINFDDLIFEDQDADHCGGNNENIFKGKEENSDGDIDIKLLETLEIVIPVEGESEQKKEEEEFDILNYNEELTEIINLLFDDSSKENKENDESNKVIETSFNPSMSVLKEKHVSNKNLDYKEKVNESKYIVYSDLTNNSKFNNKNLTNSSIIVDQEKTDFLNKKRNVESKLKLKENSYKENSVRSTERKRKRVKMSKPTSPIKFPNLDYTNKFIHLSNSENEENEENAENKLSIVTYNILNQIYMKKEHREDLTLENRMTKIIKELSVLNADIICLQEADLNIHKTFISKGLLNYNFFYGVNCGSSFINIIGFKKEKYKLISFKNFSLLGMKVFGNRGVMNITIEQIENREKISIYNIHLPWRDEQQRCEILEKVFTHMKENDVSKVFLAGDFNSEPDSLPINIILFEKFLNSIIWGDNKKLKDVYLAEDQMKIYENIQSKYKMKSAYEDYKLHLKEYKEKAGEDYLIYFKNNDNHPEITSCTEYFKKTIDYIFYSSPFELTKILKLPEKEIILEEGFLPSARFPSDHLKIYAEFKLI